MKKKEILIHQPFLGPYRIPILNELTKKFKIILSLDDKKKNKEKINSKITKIVIKKINFKLFNFRLNFIGLINRKKIKAVILPSDVKNLTWYRTIFYCKKKGVPCFIWGHGLFKKNLDNIFIFIFYFIIFKFYEKYLTKYICYNNLVKKSLIKIGFNPKKLVVINNTLQKEILIKKNISSNNKKDILFIGRLRRNNNLDFLFRTLSLMKLKKINIRLHIFGDGIFYNRLKRLAAELNIDVKFHGEVYDSKKIKIIADKCFGGVYPGDCGLSVVDFFYYGLPVLVHDDLKFHMGPEPYYVKNNYNGLLFKRNSEESLLARIKLIYNNKFLIKKLSINSIKTFKNLNKVKMSEKFEKLLIKN